MGFMPRRSWLFPSRPELLKVFDDFVERGSDLSGSGHGLEKPASQLNFEGVESQGSINLVTVSGGGQAVIMGKPCGKGIEVVADDLGAEVLTGREP